MSVVKTVPPKPKSIYFGGCSFGAAFYIGVLKAFRDMWGEDYWKDIHFSGGSAGTIFAVGCALGLTPEDVDDFYSYVSTNASQKGTIYHASDYTEKVIRKMVSDPLSYKKLEGRCCVGTTTFFSKHRWHVSWKDNEDLIQCIRTSIHIPIYCKRVPVLRGEYAFDGAYGFSGEDLPHGDDTLYVGIDPHAEITRHFTNSEMFFPQTGSLYASTVDSGYEAAMKWDGKMNKKVGYRTANISALYVLWTLRIVEYIFYTLYDSILTFFSFLVSSISSVQPGPLLGLLVLIGAAILRSKEFEQWIGVSK